mgnify:CR=1 FL=1
MCAVEPIVGPRFECLHCRSTADGYFNVCIDCEPRLHEPGAHPAGHSFRPIMPLNALLVTSDVLALSLALSAKGLAVF